MILHGGSAVFSLGEMLQSTRQTSRDCHRREVCPMHNDYNTPQQLLAKRDQKVKEHLEQYAPVWIVDEKMLMTDEAIQFTVLFLHSTANELSTPAWVTRRYRYDAFNDTLYYKGQIM